MGADPGTEQIPEPFHSVDIDFVHAVPIGFASVFPLAVIDRDMDIALDRETGVNAVLVGIDGTSLLDHQSDPGLDRRLPDIAAEPEETLPTTRDHAQHWWLVSRGCPTPPFPFTPSATTYTPLFCTSAC